jgi:hypothetical protein
MSSENKYESSGASSRVIEDVMKGKTVDKNKSFILTEGGLQETDVISFPHDYDDFSRCKKLLDNHPEWIDEFKTEMSKISNTWRKIVDIWFELNWLYIDGKNKEITDKLKKCV